MENIQKTAIVTGGTSGIGLATVQQLVGEGFNVVVNSRNVPSNLHALVSHTSGEATRIVHVAGDMRIPETSRRLAETALAEFGRIDAIVHAAGGPANGTVLSQTQETWEDAFDVHVHSAFHLFRAAHPALSQQGGSVVFLSSAAALRGCPGTIAYQTVKAALIQMARALARDHASERIRVNCVAPGIIRTPFQAAMTPEARKNNLENRIPLGREGTAEQVARLISHLIWNEFMTGETVVLDGGMSMRMV